MNILISDYRETLKRDLGYEIELLQKELPGCQVNTYVYRDDSREEFLKILSETDGLLTAFIHLGPDALNAAAGRLKCVSFNSTGYNFIDLEQASAHNVLVCHIKEYCTQEVAEHTMALLLALARDLKHYDHDTDGRNLWSYTTASDLIRLEGSTLSIFGFGKIGHAVAKRAQVFGMRILVVDPYLPAEAAEKAGVTMTDKETALREADFVSNHMAQTKENHSYFDEAAFRAMERHPAFINVSRGEAVDEAALAKALDEKWIRSAGLDVLVSESPDLVHHPLNHRENVILTPHAAFYSKTSIRELQRLSVMNLVYCLRGEKEKAFRCIN